MKYQEAILKNNLGDFRMADTPQHLQLKINGWAKWVSLFITMFILVCGVVAFAVRTEAKVCSLETKVEKKVNKELYDNDMTYIRRDLKEIKELLKK